jgi:hypothetical protein
MLRFLLKKALLKIIHIFKIVLLMEIFNKDIVISASHSSLIIILIVNVFLKSLYVR